MKNCLLHQLSLFFATLCPLVLFVPPVFAEGSSSPFSGVVQINEVMASNGAILADEDGDYEDWIEIYNQGDEVIDLSGWGLSDDYERPFRWVFPNGSEIAGGELLLVWASGKDRANLSTPLHTNYSISATGEEVVLTDQNGLRVDDLPPTSIPRNVSIGRVTGEESSWFFFEQPTPGSQNTTFAYNGLLEPPMFSRSGGTFQDVFLLELTTTFTETSIRYTTDGSLPTGRSPMYRGPITISETVQIRARAFAPGRLPSLPLSEVYMELDPSLTEFSSNLPLIVIHNFGGGNIPQSPVSVRQFAGIAVFEPGEDGRSSLMSSPTLATRTGINIRGSSTKGFPKSSYRLEFWDEVGDGEEGRAHPLLGMPAEEDWVLYGPNQFDIPLIHNPFAYTLSNDIGRYAPRHRFVEVFVNTSGQAISGVEGVDYRGVYVLVENIKRSAERVEIESLSRGETDPEKITGGYLFKIDRQGPDERSFSTAGMRVIYRYPSGIEMETESRSVQANFVKDYFDSFYQALNGPDPMNPDTGYAAFIDVGSWIDHHLLNVLPMNVDALRLSAHFHKRRGEKLEMGPVWDFDRSMGTSRGDSRPFNPRTWRALSGDQGTDYFNQANIFRNSWYSQLFRQIDFWQAYVDRYQELRDSFFSEEHLFNLVDSLGVPLMEAQEREVARWGGQGPSNTRPRSGTVSLNGYTHRFPGTYQGELDFMKRWLGDRLNFMDGNFLSRPKFSHAGQQLAVGESLAVTLDAPDGGDVFFTLDGSDPRLPGGEMAGSAQVYSGPIQVEPGMIIAARAHDPEHRNMTGGSNPPLSTPWSGVSRAAFFPIPPQVGEVPEVVKLIAGGEPAMVVLSEIFNTGGAAPSFTVGTSAPEVGTAKVEGNILTLKGLMQGEAELNIMADDGSNPPVEVKLRLLVYPAPFLLAEGEFIFDEWSADEPAGRYPAHMLFVQSGKNDPDLSSALTFAYSIPETDSFQEEDVAFPYAAERRSRINALGEDGISFINTGRGRDLGAAILSLDTRGVRNIDVAWTGGTVTPNSRIYALRLQYRIGSGPWVDLIDETGSVVEYVRSEVTDDALRIGPVRLPESLQNQPYLQLQWRYYHRSVTSGPRAELRLDDISVRAVVKPESYSAWVARAFSDPTDHENPAVVGPAADPGGAGVPNLLRYALALDNEETSRHLFPRLEVKNGHLSLRFRRDARKTDIAYLVEAASSISDWNELLYDSRVDLHDNNEGELMRVFDSISLSEAYGNRFLRLRIELLE